VPDFFKSFGQIERQVTALSLERLCSLPRISMLRWNPALKASRPDLVLLSRKDYESIVVRLPQLRQIGSPVLIPANNSSSS